MMQWGHVQTIYELPQLSDHTLMLFNLKTTHWIPRTPFRFFNIWADHSKFRSIIEDIWARQMATDPMENLRRKLRMLKSPLKDLNKEEFKGIEMKLSKARMDIQQVQNQLTRNGSDTLILLEKKILQDLEKWSNIEESALKQKSRAKWIQLGDGNNQYFSAVIKERVNMKQILILTSLTGVILSEQKDIKEEILTFYKSLMGSAAQTLPAVNSVIMRKGPVLNHQQGRQLCRPVTDEEIHSALLAIGDDKAPGVDGYNAYFYKKNLGQ
ncbi:hypothetical protein KY290_011027 [Solanum tuberosum]|uniref:Non-LTR retroelement reverse transcriptase n=1 Tax=Solanum tuberosum TaxID=4113 RepID=A0ABQ7VZH4_SOLTU|nr:hypothetical protein KY290_011027 [Solanum tuberosum]